MKRAISLVLALLLLLALLPAAFAEEETPENGWYTDEEGRRFYYADGELVKGCSRQIDGAWYFFDTETGEMLKGGTAVGADGRSYRAKADGTLYVSTWYLYTENYNEHWFYYTADGGSLSGYQKVGSYYYVFRASDGEMLPYGAQTYEGTSYYIDIYGHATPLVRNGWTIVDGDWFYCVDGVAAVNGVRLIDLHYYAFDWEGRMFTDKNSNWELGNGVKIVDLYDSERGQFLRCHASSTGILDTNKWLDCGAPLGDGVKRWMYFGSDARAYVSGCYRVGNKWYDFDYMGYTTGTVVRESGWVKKDGVWYYYTDDGWAVTGWQRIGGQWYYFTADGKMVANGWARDSIGWCWMDADGHMAKSKWILYKGDWYYLNENGYMAVNAWVRDGKGWCKLGGDGKMLKSVWIKDAGEWIYLDAAGHMAFNAWAKDSCGWCWMGADGHITKSEWLKYGGNWYYLDDSGYMVTGRHVIDGKTYTFLYNGIWVG